MAINQVKVTLSEDVSISRLEQVLEIGDEKVKTDQGIKNVQVLFDDHFLVEVKHKSPREVVLVITSRGISREMDAATFQHLITMNY